MRLVFFKTLIKLYFKIKGLFMKKLLFVTFITGLLSANLLAGTWVEGKLSTIQQWENNSYFVMTSTSPEEGTVKSSISTILNEEGQKKLLTLMLLAQSMNSTIKIYLEDDDVDYAGGTTHLMKSVKILP